VPCLSGELSWKTGTGNGTSTSDKPYHIAKHIGTPKVEGCDTVSCGRESKNNGPQSQTWTLSCQSCGKLVSNAGWRVLESHATREEADSAFLAWKAYL